MLMATEKQKITTKWGFFPKNSIILLEKNLIFLLVQMNISKHRIWIIE